VRFASSLTGQWHYKFYVHTANHGDDSSSLHSFTITGSATDKGYVKVAPNGRNFCFADSTVFFPLGVNTAMPGLPETAYNRIPYVVNTSLMPHMAARGGNFARLMMTPTQFGIEWIEDGTGVYDKRQDRAFDLDAVFEAAEQNNMYLQISCVGDEFDSATLWQRNPYRNVNGGFIDHVDQFFTDSQCIYWYKNKLCYMMARWGYSAHWLGMEFIQEIDHIGDSTWHSLGWDFWGNHANMRNWYREMIQYGKKLNKHVLYTVSFATGDGGPTDIRYSDPLDSIPELDFISSHDYDARYNIGYFRNYAANKNMSLFPQKPALFEEYGTTWGAYGIAANSYKGVSTFGVPDWHLGLWAMCFAGSAGPPLYWPANGGTDVYHDKTLTNQCWGGQDEYFRPVSIFLKDEPIFKGSLHPIANPCTGTGPKDTIYHDPANNRCHCHIVDDSSVYNNYTSSGISTTNDSLIEVFGLKTNDRVIGYIHNKQYYWYKLPRQTVYDDTVEVATLDDNFTNSPGMWGLGIPNIATIPQLNSDSASVYSLAPGHYKIQFYSAYSGRPTRFGGPDTTGGIIDTFTLQDVAVNCDSILKFKIPPLKPIAANDSLAPYAPDYGFKASYIGDESSDTIFTNTTWNTHMHIFHSVITIKPGATLTIQNDTVEMPANGIIKVMPGAHLVIDHALLERTDTNCSRLWGGIQAAGVSTLPQNPATDAWVQLYNSTINDALAAVSNWDGDATHTGGIIQAENCNFKNNYQSAVFHPYSNRQGPPSYTVNSDLSQFVNCSFTADNKMISSQDSNYYQGMVFMNSVYNIQFIGCSFTNRDTASAIKGQGYGIYSHNAGYAVVPVCTSVSAPCTSWRRSYFAGLQTGILADGNGLYDPNLDIVIDQCDMDSCSVGVHIRSCNNTSSTQCKINVGRGLATHDFDNLGCHQNMGIIAENAHLLRIEEDTLNGFAHPAGISDWRNLGVVVQNTGYYNSKVYKTYFNALDIGCYSNGNNGGVFPLPPIGYPLINHKGLRIECSHFANDTSDIYVEGANIVDGIQQWQGGVDSAAHNIFATGGSIINYGTTIDYYYDSTALPNSKPSYTYGAVYLIKTGAGGSCPNSFDVASTFRMAKADTTRIQNLKSSFISSQVTLLRDTRTRDSLVAAGDTTGIGSLNMKISEEGEGLSNYAGDIMRALRTDHNITSACAIVSDSSSIWYMRDSNSHYVYIDSIGPWLLHIGDLSSQYDLVGYYNFMDPQDTSKLADTALSHAQAFLGTDSAMNSEYGNYRRLWNVLRALDTSSRSIYQISAAEADTLNAIAKLGGDDAQASSYDVISAIMQGGNPGGMSVPGHYHGTMLEDCTPYYSHRPAKSNGKNNSQYSKPPIQPVGNIRPGSMLAAYPNPASSIVNFSYRVPDGTGMMTLRISDAIGKEIIRFDIKDSEGTIQWDIHLLAPGMYIYILSDDKGMVGMGKLVAGM
jgi:hypothetical protein